MGGFIDDAQAKADAIIETGGEPLVAVSTFLIEGKIAAPQTETLCNLKNTLADKMTDIETMLSDLKTDVNKLILDPIKDFADTAMTAVGDATTAVTAALNDAVKMADSACAAVINEAQTQITAASDAVSGMASHVADQITDNFKDLSSSISGCSLPELPSTLKPILADVTQSFSQGVNIDSLTSTVTDMTSKLGNLSLNPTDFAAQLTGPVSDLTSKATGLKDTLTSDLNNISSGKLANTTARSVLDTAKQITDPNIGSFVSTLVNPIHAPTITAISDAITSNKTTLTG